MNFLKKNYSALLFSLFLALMAYFLGNIFPVIGGPAFAIILGVILGNLKLNFSIPHEKFTKSSKVLLAMSLSLLGFGLSLKQIIAVGANSLVLMIFTISTAFLVAFLGGRWLKISFNLTTLIGIGTAICGGSAIAALAPIIKANEDDISYAISTIFIFNLAAVFIFPVIGHFLGLSDEGFGLWAGTAINDTSSVLAAAYSFGASSGDYAAIVKLTRTTLIVPICLLFTFIMMKKNVTESGEKLSFALAFKVFPKFIIYFLLASFIVSMGFIPANISAKLSALAKFLIIWALASVGLGSNFKKMIKEGLSPFILGLLVWVSLSTVTLVIQLITVKL